MKKWLLVSLLLLSACEAPQAVKKEAPSVAYTEAYALMKVWLEAQRDYDKLPGVSVTLVHEEATDWSFATGEVAQGVPLTTASQFSICSISKLFTAIAVMQLVEQGKIQLEDPLIKHLPEFNIKQQYNDSGPITIANVLSHSSGLPRESNHPYWSAPDFKFPTKGEVLKALQHQESLYPADTYFQYSNLGLTLLGYVVEAVSGQSYDTYIQEHILAPLKMQAMSTYMDASAYGNALVYGYSATQRDGSRYKVPFFNAEGIGPAAGFSSTPKDLAKFARWQLEVLKGEASEILTAATLKKMHAIQWEDPLTQVKRGLGFGIYPDGEEIRVGHGGSCPGYRSVLSIDPTAGNAVAVMINASGTNPSRYANGIRNILEKTALEAGASPHQFADIEGFYDSQPWSGETYITSWGSGIAELSLPSASARLTTYRYIKKDVFRRELKNDSLGEYLYILRDSIGAVKGFKQHQNIYRYKGVQP